MRILNDTNVLVSALLFPDSISAKAVEKVMFSHHLVLCQRVIEELHLVFARKFPDNLGILDNFLKKTSYELAYTPSRIEPAKRPVIRDLSDYPILESAILSEVDIIVSGDKDFTEVELEKPLILTPSAFLSKVKR